MSRCRLASGWTLAACLLVICAVTLVPAHGPSELQLRPGEAPLLGDVLNAVLFAPLGAVLFVRRFGLGRTVLAGCALSVSIELLQRVVPGRTTSLDDVISNTLGTLLGYVLASALRARFG